MKIKLKLNKSFSSSISFGLEEGSFEESNKYEFDQEVEGEYEQDGKQQHASHIFKCTKSPNENEIGKFFRGSEGRSGSYHTDWYYDSEYDKNVELTEVEQKEIKITRWVTVDDN
jgi:hypothetical protein